MPFYVYILANKDNSALYTGVTNDLVKRVTSHKMGIASKFTKRYSVTKLVYFETCDDPIVAISREKQIKSGSRRKKIEMINSMNGNWRDLFDEITDCHALRQEPESSQ